MQLGIVKLKLLVLLFYLLHAVMSRNLDEHIQEKNNNNVKDRLIVTCEGILLSFLMKYSLLLRGDPSCWLWT